MQRSLNLPTNDDDESDSNYYDEEDSEDDSSSSVEGADPPSPRRTPGRLQKAGLLPLPKKKLESHLKMMGRHSRR
ncbi:hypothetical protein MJO28_008804 [Puccinia striiformis f. sp. tritici]|uniref:Uncharacterized protein n=2 Tax=Puccinia striiformis f. sp. tritici TaxID=168172 RepID=A0ACC0ECU7_9BASI|nr:hypothetical protein MJO28_013580 [Puccinia striiformis f. sp. tritici]KAI7949983.1 hypothetical protein MJO28_008804 [Puccinia striiformis f. sp. tritici]